jgi:hypothetical protein
MKKMTYAVSLAALATTGAVALGAGTASAAAPGSAAPAPGDPHTLSVPLAPGFQYTSNTDDRSTVVATPFGTVTTQGSQVQVVDNKGKALYGQQNFATPPKAATTSPATTATSATSKTAPVTPHQVDAPAQAKPVDQLGDFETAIGTAGTNFGLATGVGAMIGGVSGVIVGCPIGAVTLGLTSAVVAAPTSPLGAVVGCVTGASVAGGLGAILGGAALGIPVGVASAVQAYNTLHAQGDV